MEIRSWQTASYSPYLDGIRGLAALWVMIAHVMIWGGWYWKPFPDPKIAVDLFMILSGYLMARQNLSGKITEPAGRRTVFSFYLKRFFRIAPVYYILLLGTFALHSYIAEGLHFLQATNAAQWVHEGGPLSQCIYDPYRVPLTWGNALAHLTFTFGIFPRYSLATTLPDWSIGLEMQFYLFFPLLAAFLRRFRYFAPLVALVALSLLTNILLGHLPSPVPNSDSYYPEPSLLLLKLPLFLLGMIVSDSLAAQDSTSSPRILMVLAATFLASYYSHYVVALVVLLYFLGAREESPATDQRTKRSLLRRYFSSLLGNSFTRRLADFSYSVYLVHLPCIALWTYVLQTNPVFHNRLTWGRTCLLGALVIPSSYIIAMCLHWLIERPGITFGRHLSGALLGHAPHSRIPAFQRTESSSLGETPNL